MATFTEPIPEQNTEKSVHEKYFEQIMQIQMDLMREFGFWPGDSQVQKWVDEGWSEQFRTLVDKDTEIQRLLATNTTKAKEKIHLKLQQLGLDNRTLN